MDPERAKSGPFGTAIAHGYLTLSLGPGLLREVVVVEGVSMGVNYGCNKVRFPAPVPVDSNIRSGGDRGRGRGVPAVSRWCSSWHSRPKARPSRAALPRWSSATTPDRSPDGGTWTRLPCQLSTRSSTDSSTAAPGASTMRSPPFGDHAASTTGGGRPESCCDVGRVIVVLDRSCGRTPAGRTGRVSSRPGPRRLPEPHRRYGLDHRPHWRTAFDHVVEWLPGPKTRPETLKLNMRLRVDVYLRFRVPCTNERCFRSVVSTRALKGG